MSSGSPNPAVFRSGRTLARVTSGGTFLIPVSGEYFGQRFSSSIVHHRSIYRRVTVVAPLLFQTAFNYASYPQVPGRSTLLCGLAPVGSRRFTKSRGTSPPDGSSCLPGLCRFCALATALAVSDFRSVR